MAKLEDMELIARGGLKLKGTLMRPVMKSTSLRLTKTG